MQAIRILDTHMTFNVKKAVFALKHNFWGGLFFFYFAGVSEIIIFVEFLFRHNYS